MLQIFSDEPYKANFKSLFHVDNVPCDTRLREILDPVDPRTLRPAFRALFAAAQRAKALEKFRVLGDYYLLALDGTEHFCSYDVQCDSCMTRCHRDGRIGHYHQTLGAALAKPGLRQVLPLCPEPIVRADGSVKNDCERNAARRFLGDFRRDHPKLRAIVVEDALAANGPHLQDLIAANCDFIIRAKEGDQSFLWAETTRRRAAGEVRALEVVEKDTRHKFECFDHTPRNASHPDLWVHAVHYQQWSADGQTLKFQAVWITRLTVQADTALEFAQCGRARWKIENETFNTLKTQGYHFEHNFGHGEAALATVLMLLMFLAFAVDQLQELACPVFQAARDSLHARIVLWEELRARFRVLEYPSMTALLAAVALRNQRPAKPARKAAARPPPA